jgi:hypothetical protein
MAEQKRPPEKLKRAELIAALEQSRHELSDDLLDLRNSLSVTRRVKSNFQRHTKVWLGGGLIVGFLLARPLLRKGSRKPRDEDGEHGEKRATRLGGAFAGATAFAGRNLFKAALPLLRLAVTSYFDKKVAEKTVEEPETLTDSHKQ